MTTAIALLAGVLFGSGLLLSEMTNPANVIAFLDVTGDWKPALAFTMAGAIAVAFPAFALLRARGVSLRNQPVQSASHARVDAPLLMGSAIFGIGWGLSGICPGPGLLLLSTADVRAFAFLAGAVTGVWLAGPVIRRRGGEASNLDRPA